MKESLIKQFLMLFPRDEQQIIHFFQGPIFDGKHFRISELIHTQKFLEIHFSREIIPGF
jgi:hypothetical protein